MEFITKNYKKIVFVTGGLFFSFLFILSWFFYKERALSFDPAFFSFEMVDTKSFSIALGRWGAVFSEILPLLALKMHCSMESFLRLFSVAPVINYIIVFLIILRLKNYRAALALMLALCVGFRHAFYYTTAELYLGIALSVLLWALISEENLTVKKKNIRLLVSLVLMYVMSYLHQLTLFTIVFVLVTEIFGRGRYKDKHLWVLLGATVIWFMIRIFLLTSTAYEAGKIPTASVFIEQLPNLRYLPSTIYFKHFAPANLWTMFLLFLAAWYYLLRSKRWLYFLFLPAYSLGFLVLILITYYKGESPLMYENYYTVLGFFAVIAFVFASEGYFRKPKELVVITLLLIINCVGVLNAHDILTKRIDYIERLVSFGRKQEKKKFLIAEQNFPWQYAWVKWSLPFETALYSALKGPDSVVTFYVTNDMGQYDSLLNKTNVFLGPDWAITWFESHNLQKQYFHFPSTGYEKLSSWQSDTAFHEAEFNRNNILIKPLKEKYYSDTDSFIVAEVNIKNLLGKRFASIPAGAHPTYLSYHVYKDGQKVIADGRRTPLETDLINEHTQGVIITLPGEKGDYTIELDLVTENKRWWGINSRVALSVN